MTPLERAARAIAHNPTFADGLTSAAEMRRWEDDHWPEFVPTARAVLAAIREPSEGMLKAGVNAPGAQYVAVRLQGQWEAMIDHALAEGE